MCFSRLYVLHMAIFVKTLARGGGTLSHSWCWMLIPPKYGVGETMPFAPPVITIFMDGIDHSQSWVVNMALFYPHCSANIPYYYSTRTSIAGIILLCQ